MKQVSSCPGHLEVDGHYKVSAPSQCHDGSFHLKTLNLRAERSQTSFVNVSPPCCAQWLALASFNHNENGEMKEWLEAGSHPELLFNSHTPPVSNNRNILPSTTFRGIPVTTQPEAWNAMVRGDGRS